MFPEQTYGLNPIADPAAGTRPFQVMKNKARTMRTRIRVTGDYVITAAGTKIRNRGSILAALGLIGVEENGDETVKADARALAHIARSYTAGREVGERLTDAQAAAAATYTLSEEFDLHFSTPYQVSPTETSYAERDTRQALQMFYNIVADPALISDATATIQNLRIEAVQILDDKRGEKPLFVPRIRQIVQDVAAANDGLDVYIKASRYLRGLCVSQDSPEIGEVSDIINALTLQGDDRVLIGPKLVPWDVVNNGQYLDHPGMLTDSPAHTWVPLMRHGRLSTILNPAADRNLRFTFDCQPSATAGAVNSKIRVTLVELAQVEGVTADQLPAGFAA